MMEIVTGVLWIVGSVFALLAAVGVLRMPDVFTRMQASTKASTLLGRRIAPVFRSGAARYLTNGVVISKARRSVGLSSA